MNNGRIQGIFTPNLVPLDEQGEINEPELRRYVDWLIDRGVHGLYPNGSTGEFTRFTAGASVKRIIEIIVDQNRLVASPSWRVPRKRILKRRFELASTLCTSWERARGRHRVSPFYYKLAPEGVYAYFKEIADHSPLDITLYNIPLFASPIDVPTVRRLAEECPRVVAIKDSSGDVANMMRMITAVRPLRPEFSFLTGWEAVLLPMLLIGCDGGTNATSGIVPEITRRLYDLTQAGRLDDARDLQYRLLPLFDAMLYSAEFPEGFRAALNLRGFRTGQGRQPQSAHQRQQLEQLRRELQCLLAGEGFTDEPVGGCPAGQGVDDEQVALIVQGVVDELKRRGLS